MYNRHPTITKIDLVHLPRKYIDRIIHDCSLLYYLLLLYRPPDKVRTGKYFFYFTTKTYVVDTQKNRLNDYPKHMFKLMGKEMNAILDALTILI